MIEKHSNKIWIFTVNVLLLLVGILFIRNYEQKKLISEITKTSSDVNPVDSAILKSQEAILIDREQKLRNVNTTPKQTQQINTTTTTTTSTPAPASSSSSSSSKTKTS
jgi:hypothetical protein